ncbi:TonB-dependent receptor [Sphingobium sp. TA15]|uniref:TonB-dependent receptor-like protein n=2 Tax=Sphingomonadaceae TaxID=41297 RepID=D4Z7K8_SPHIU|nr:TonB-dependent receptor-like protein [Sphingobium indicum UT26S]BDD68531.1 TonB-dependent receptor [Sphingobium sp. TA15]
MWGEAMNICNRSAFIILMLSTSSAMAQTAPFSEDAQADAAAAAQGAGGQIEEIVVTAQKRAENIQRVPIAISALGGEALANKGFDSLATLTKLAPSLQLSNYGPIAFVTMRGIGNENTTAGGDPGVAFHYDGVYIGRPIGTLFSAFDTERVEILRGPQGTLYGRNATGGSINYITRKPGDELEGHVDMTAGKYDMWRVRGAVNLPLSDAVSTRIVAFREKRDGFTRNSVPGGTDANDANNWGVRGHVRIEPASDFSVLLSGVHIHSGGVGSQPEIRTPFPGSTTGRNLGGPQIAGLNNYLVNGVPLVNDLRPFHEGKNSPEYQRNSLSILSANLEYDLGAATIKSITAYAESKFSSQADTDYSPKDLGVLDLEERAHQFSQELQILSNAGANAPFNWILGAYYFREKGFRQSAFRGGRYAIVAANNNVPDGFRLAGDVTSKSYAFFGQATVRPLDRWSITGGLRYTHDEKDGVNSGFQFTPPSYSGPVGGQWEKVTYRIATDYQLTDAILGYVSYSTGYKSGGINQAINPLLSNAVFQPETVKAMEAGLKSQLFDRRLQVNLAAYRNKYDDLQFQILGPFGAQAYNASGATVQGVELEFQAAPTSWFRLDGSGAYTDATFDPQLVQNVQLGGNRVQRTPKWTANVGGSVSFPIRGFGEGRLRVDYSYTSRIFYTAFNRAAPFPVNPGSDLAPGYENVDMRLFLTTADDRWTGEVFVTNLFDTVQTGNVFRGIGFNDVPGGGGAEVVTYKPPRQYGLRIGYKF